MITLLTEIMECKVKIFMGVDVSKGYSDFTLIDESGHEIFESFQLDDTSKGYSILTGILEDLCTEDGAQIYSAVESTAGYENNWHNFLYHLSETLPLHVTRLNPFGVKRMADASLDRNKTDKSSSFHIAEYLRRYPEQIRYNEENPYQSFRKYWTFISLQMKMARQLSNNLQNVVYSANPELLQYCKFGFSEKILNVLKDYSTARKLARARVKKLSKIQGVTEQEAKNMIAAAKTSVASLQDTLTEDMIKTSVAQLQMLSQQIDNSVKSVLKQKRPKEIDLLMSIPGIGEKSALGLYLEIGPIQRFKSSKELASYAGIHPIIRASGDGQKRPKMSKRGRKTLRSILFMPAMVAARRDQHIKTYYEKHLEKGKSKMSALGIIMHKLLRIVFGVLKSGNPYNPEIDRKNIQRERKYKTEEKQTETVRRFQEFEQSAPISKHAAKKRKQSVSHSCEAKNAGSKTAENENTEILQPVNINGEK